MKRVSLKVAKALKEAGYPQRINGYVYLETGSLVPYSDFYSLYFLAPTYLDAWLWLWREKGIKIVAEPRQKVFVYIKTDFYGLPKELASVFEDPEEAIIGAINHLVDNDLINEHV